MTSVSEDPTPRLPERRQAPPIVLCVYVELIRTLSGGRGPLVERHRLRHEGFDALRDEDKTDHPETRQIRRESPRGRS